MAVVDFLPTVARILSSIEDIDVKKLKMKPKFRPAICHKSNCNSSPGTFQLFSVTIFCH